jgi:hypothetical protein
MVKSVVEDFKDQFITLIAIFPQKGIQVFHSRGFQGLITVTFKYRTDGVEDELALVYGFRSEISRSLG